MDESRWQKMYREEAAVLGKIGQLFLGAEMPQIEVRLPRDAAEAAVAAWERDDDENAGPIGETFKQRVVRSRAASLSLIGLAMSERGRWMDDDVVVALDPRVHRKRGRSSRRSPDLTDCLLRDTSRSRASARTSAGLDDNQ